MSACLARSLHTATRLAALLLTTAALAACHAEAASTMGSSGTASSSSAGASGNAAMGSFKGLNGTARVSGHELRARDGQLTLDGVPYGTVEERSEARLVVREGLQPMVTVNAVVRDASAVR